MSIHKAAATASTTADPKWIERIARLYFFGILSIYFVLLLASRHAPMLQDYPTWVYEGVAVSHALGGHLEPQFALKRYPVPNAVTDVGLGLLTSIFGWQWAARLWISLYLLLSAGTTLHLLRSTRVDRTFAYCVSPTIGIVNLCFWYGFLNFQIAVAFTILFCSLLLREHTPSLRLSIVLLIVFLSHAVAFLFCCVALFSYILCHKRYRFATAFAPSAMLGLWYIFGRFYLSSDRESDILPSTPIPYGSRSFLIFKANTFFKSVGYVNPDWYGQSLAVRLFGHRGMCLLVVVSLLLGLALLYILIFSGLAGGKSVRFLRVVFWIAIVAAALCPSQALGVSDPGSRFMVCALTLGVLLASPPLFLGRIASLASITLGILGVCTFATIVAGTPPLGASASPPPQGFAKFAHVGPASRSFYYDALTRGQMDLPVFNTGLLINSGSRK